MKLRFRWPRRAVVRVTEQPLTRRRIYIVPTRNGFLLGLVLTAMLIGAMNYGNSLAYGLTFLLGSMAVISIVHTFRNLNGLTVKTGQCRPVFAGDTALFPIAVENPGDIRYSVIFELEGGRAITDVAAHGLTWVELRHGATQRGWCVLPRVTTVTTFPLGLFRAWSYLDLDQRCLIYPRPEIDGPSPPGGAGLGEEAKSGSGSDDFAALRDYRAGDSLRHVHWKALAREQGLLTKEFEGGGGRDLLFDWDQLAGLAPEARLSRLCRWVLMADTRGLRYGLRLPGHQVELGRGAAHRHLCLQALALYGGGA